MFLQIFITNTVKLTKNKKENVMTKRCADVFKTISDDLRKEKVDVLNKESYTSTGANNFHAVCSKFVEVFSKHVNLTKYFTPEEIERGFPIAQDSLSCLENGHDFNTVCDSYYGMSLSDVQGRFPDLVVDDGGVSNATHTDL
ncbi:hypothetical protein MIDIC_470013 [Alphaproteobacteria bacterium]